MKKIVIALCFALISQTGVFAADNQETLQVIAVPGMNGYGAEEGYVKEAFGQTNKRIEVYQSATPAVSYARPKKRRPWTAQLPKTSRRCS